MEPEAYAELARSEQAGLLRLAWALTRDTHLAHDLAQESLVRGFVKRRLVEKADSPRAYLRTIMLNLWRGRRPRPEHPADHPPERPTVDDHHLARAALVEALATLPQQQRAIVALRHLDDLSVRETATVLGCSEQTVTTQCARALARLRTHTELADLLED